MGWSGSCGTRASRARGSLRELGRHEGTLGRWVNLDRRAREGEGPLSESERYELNRMRGNRRAGDRARCTQALGCQEAMRRLAALIDAEGRARDPGGGVVPALGVSQAWFSSGAPEIGHRVGNGGRRWRRDPVLLIPPIMARRPGRSAATRTSRYGWRYEVGVRDVDGRGGCGGSPKTPAARYGHTGQPRKAPDGLRRDFTPDAAAGRALVPGSHRNPHRRRQTPSRDSAGSVFAALRPIPDTGCRTVSSPRSASMPPPVIRSVSLRIQWLNDALPVHLVGAHERVCATITLI